MKKLKTGVTYNIEVGDRYRYPKSMSLSKIRRIFAQAGFLITRETYKKDGVTNGKAYRTIRVTQRFK